MMTAEEAREISKVNDLSYVYSLISDAAHRGEYRAECDAISKENCEVLGKQGYKVEIVEKYDMLSRIADNHFRISWRYAE